LNDKGFGAVGPSEIIDKRSSSDR